MILDINDVMTGAELADMMDELEDIAEAKHHEAMYLAEIDDERRAHLAFNFPVSHGPHAAQLSAEWDHEDRQQCGW